MATFIGASPEELEVLAQVMADQAGSLTSIDGRVRAQLAATTWYGRDMEGFSGRWSGELSGQLAAAAQLLQAVADAVRRQAQQQRTASGAVGAGAGGTAGGIASWATNGYAGDPGVAVGLGLGSMLMGAKEIYDPVDALRTLVREAPELVRNTRGFLAAGGALRDAELLFDQTRNLEIAKLNATLLQAGDPGDYTVLRQWFAGREVLSAAAAEPAAAASRYGAIGDALVKGATLTTTLGRVGGVIGVVGGLHDFIDPPHDDWRSPVDRSMGLLTAGASGLGLAAGAGLLTLTPPGAIVVGGVLAVGAAWTIGNTVWDHREAIGHGAAVATDWVGDRAADVGGWTADKAGDAAGAVSDAASDVAHGVGHKASGAWNAAEGLF